MEIWSKCDICGRDIPVGELCYGLKKGNCICKNCCTGFENCTFTLAPMPTLTQPNEPMTLEQLREMDGEPVYVHNLFPAKRKFEWQWALVCKERGNAEATTYTYRFLDYGKTWIAYRRPPEGEEDT